MIIARIDKTSSCCGSYLIHDFYNYVAQTPPPHEFYNIEEVFSGFEKSKYGIMYYAFLAEDQCAAMELLNRLGFRRTRSFKNINSGNMVYLYTIVGTGAKFV